MVGWFHILGHYEDNEVIKGGEERRGKSMKRQFQGLAGGVISKTQL